jgi:hypothetical protein
VLGSIASTYRETVVDEGTQPLLFMLIAFGLTFGLTRFITHSIRSQRFSWLGDIEAGDTHIHHLVWGICLLLISGVVAIVLQPPLEVTAIIFGIGAALTLDEFALWLHLDDVYWSEQGRQSIDAVIVFTIVTGFMLVGAYPISIGPEPTFGDAVGLIFTQIFNLTFVVICLLKGKLMYGVLGFYIPPVAIVGSIRLARPESRWARKRYDDEKLARSKARYDVEKKSHRPTLDPEPAQSGASPSDPEPAQTGASPAP